MSSQMMHDLQPVAPMPVQEDPAAALRPPVQPPAPHESASVNAHLGSSTSGLGAKNVTEQQILDCAGLTQKQAADKLNIGIATLQRYIKAYNINWMDIKGNSRAARQPSNEGREAHGQQRQAAVERGQQRQAAVENEKLRLSQLGSTVEELAWEAAAVTQEVELLQYMLAAKQEQRRGVWAVYKSVGKEYFSHAAI